MSDQSAELDRIAVRPLEGASRGLVTLVALAGLTLGVLATFKTDNQAGTAALLGLGSVAGLIALVGKLPLRWVIGGSAFDMSDEVARATVDAVTSQLNPEQTADLADHLVAVDRSHLSPMTGMMLDVVEFERKAIEKVMTVVDDHPTWEYAAPSSAADRGVDGFLIVNGRSIPVEYKWMRDAASVGSTLQSLQKHQGRRYSDLIVVFSGRPVTTLKFQKRVQLFTDPRIHPVFLDETEFRAGLEMAVAMAGATRNDQEHGI